jgi:hypothetical protein
VDRKVELRILELLRKKRILQACSVLMDVAGIRPDELEIPVRVEGILRSHGISAMAQSISADGYLSSVGGRALIVVNSERGPVVRRFIVAHEFGHWLLKHGCGIDQEMEGIRNGKEVVERLCDEFAAVLLAPASYVAGVLRRCPEGITFRSAESLSRKLQVPLRAVLSAMSRCGALSVLGKAIVVVRPMANPWGGRQWHLRIWRAYCPEWGFIPERRLERIGLDEIVSVWASARPGLEFRLRENLSVYAGKSTRSSAMGQRSWQLKKIEATEVHYKFYRDVEEGIFAVGIFDWARPAP